jgi:hypothetical protein
VSILTTHYQNFGAQSAAFSASWRSVKAYERERAFAATLRIRCDRHKSVRQTIVEIEHIVKIFAAIARRFFHLSNVDQVENDLAEIAGLMDTPFMEHVFGEHAVLLHGVLANRFAELLPGYVAFLFRFGSFRAAHAAKAKLLLRESQRLKNEKVCVAVITSVASQQFSQWMIWI